MKIQRKTFLCAALHCLICLLAGAAWSPMQAEKSGALSDWNSRLQATRTHLTAGEYRTALEIARPLQLEMLNRIESGPAAGKALAITVLSRALAEAGLGDMEAAAWDWDTAQMLDATIAQVDLTPFGAAGAALKALGPLEGTPERPIPNLEAAKDASKACNPEKETCVTKPELLRRSDLSYPDALQVACSEGNVVVASIIDEEGKIRDPRLKESPGGPVMALAALESLRSWRFRPATLEGKPVKVYYELRVNFIAKSCAKRR